MGREGGIVYSWANTSIPSYDSRDFYTSRQSVEIFLRLFAAVRKKLVLNRKFQSNSAMYREWFVPLSRTILSSFVRVSSIQNHRRRFIIFFFFTFWKLKLLPLYKLLHVNYSIFNRRPFYICNETIERRIERDQLKKDRSI